MSTEPLDIDMDALDPQAFAVLVRDATDDVLVATFRSVGVQAALDRIFDIMQGRFLADRAAGVKATVQWRIADGSDEHAYVVTIHDGACDTERGTAERPTTTLSTDLPRFARIAAGQANGVKLLMTGKLRASGDVNLARKLPGFFDIPRV